MSCSVKQSLIHSIKVIIAYLYFKNLLLVSCLLDMWRKTTSQEKYLVLLQEYLVKLRPNIKNFPLKWKVAWNGKVRIQILNEVFKIHVAEDDYVEIIGLNHTIQLLVLCFLVLISLQYTKGDALFICFPCLFLWFNDYTLSIFIYTIFVIGHCQPGKCNHSSV